MRPVSDSDSRPRSYTAPDCSPVPPVHVPDRQPRPGEQDRVGAERRRVYQCLERVSACIRELEQGITTGDGALVLLETVRVARSQLRKAALALLLCEVTRRLQGESGTGRREDAAADLGVLLGRLH